MKSLLREIRRQPEGTRQLFFVLSSITVISLVVLVWFNSFRSNVYALLNPEPAKEDSQFLATTDPQSLLGSLGTLFNGMKDQAFSLMGKNSTTPKDDSKPEVKSEKTYALPISPEK
ncbi:hypothetical protein KW791_02435 [Candidatus Parcubacteria bacterium]|nr:hypothetical protein [Candidatus Parcubacteria bacterium]